MARKSLSYKYVSYIDLAAILFLALIGSVFVYIIIHYFQWKSHEGFLESDNKNKEESVKIGAVTMMKDPKNLETWLRTNREAGISHFYIRLEDSPDVLPFLQEQEDVTVVEGKSSGVNEYNEKQTRQDLMVN